MEIYYREFGAPLYKTYTKKILPFGLQVYAMLGDDELKNINTHFKVL